MQPTHLLYTLQLMDSFFPVGAFAYSDGLETAASAGQIRDAAELQTWMDHFLESVFVPCEGLALVKCMDALGTGNFDTLHRIDEELTAIRPSRAARQASIGIGKRLLGSYATISGDSRLSELSGGLPYGNAVTAYALVFSRRGIGEREAVLAFGYNRMTGMVSAGLRSIAMGHQQGQSLLTHFIEKLPDAGERILRMKDEPIRSFSPMMDIAQMNHRYVYSRLFRS